MFYLLPQPKKMEEREGIFKLNPSYIYWQEETQPMILNAVEKLKSVLPEGWRYSKVSERSEIKKGIELNWSSDEINNEEGYVLDISCEKILIEAKTAKGAYYGIQTLMQILKQVSTEIPCLKITDYPTYKVRGLHYDISQPAMVPKIEELFTIVELLGHFKINHLQIYTEHTFRYRNHPSIGYDVNPLNSEDILKLDSYCRLHGIELVPAVPCLGHMADILCHYPDLAEDLGRGKYKIEGLKSSPRERWWLDWLIGKEGGLEFGNTISPAHPQTYYFIESLFDELLPLFSSELFNVCCDEAWELGKGQSYELCQEKGTDLVFLEHISKLKKIAEKYGKRIMCWVDVIFHYHQDAFPGEFDPKVLSIFPKDVIALNWDYSREGTRFKFNKNLKEAGLDYYVCPSTCSWGWFFPSTELAFDNILKFSQSGLQYGAEGVLNTEWRDGGINFIENAWYGILNGADISWNTEYARKELPRRFSTCFFQDCGDLGRATVLLGQSAEIIKKWRSIPSRLFFATFDELKNNIGITMEEAKKVIEDSEESLNIIRKAQVEGDYKNDVLKYYEFAAEAQVYLAEKIIFLLREDFNKENISNFMHQMVNFRERFEELWLEKYRKSELEIMVLPAFNRVIDDYQKILR